ncbi:MAG TPA: hypothetical protein IAA29_11705 [Candidatus Paenibacillus intestinavium]|nr:hypothetical protein [Candidatus Paenibacillus intestinavium]
MIVITQINTNIILDIADHTELVGSDTKVVKNGGVYFIGFEVNVHDVSHLPSDVKAETHCYDGASFSENPNYVAPYSPSDDIAILQTENTMLLARVDKLEKDNTDLQDALIELASAVEGGGIA